MPIIPLREGQGVSTGSPVAAVSTEDARKPGDNLARLGDAVQNYASELQRQGREHDKLVVADAVASWESHMNQSRNALERGGMVEGDLDGSKTMGSYTQGGKDFADQVRDNPDMSPRAKAAFTAEVNERYVKLYQPTALKSVGDLMKAKGDTLKANTLNTYASSVESDPGNYDDALAEMTNTINKTQLYTPEEKAKALIDSKQTLFDASLEGFRKRRDYDGGQAFIEIYAKDSTAKDRKALTLEMEHQKIEDLRLNWTVEVRAREANDRVEKKQSEKLMATYISQYSNATTEGARQSILQDAVAAQKSSGLRPEHFNTLLGDVDKFGKVDDNNYAAQYVLTPMTSGKFVDGKAFTFDEGRSRVMSAVGRGEISAKYGNDLVFKLYQFERAQNAKSPFMGAPLNAAFKRAEVYGLKGDMLSKAMGGLIDDPVYKARVNDVKAQLANISAQGKNPLEFVDQISARSLGLGKQPTFKGTFGDAATFNDPKKVIEKAKQMKQNGLRTPEQKQQYNNLLNGYKVMINNESKVKANRDFKNNFEFNANPVGEEE